MFNSLKKIFSKNSEIRKENHLRRVLIVDDSEVDRNLHLKMVEKLGYTTLTAHNGKEGFEAALAKKPDLILVDYEMPEMNGYEMCKRLQDNPVTEKIPIIFITGSDTPSHVIECFETEAVNCLAKPLSIKILSTQIESAFQSCSNK